MPTFRLQACAARRRGVSFTWLLLGMAVVSLLAAAAAWPYFSGREASDGARPLVHQVSSVKFSHRLIEPGEIESADNVEVRCEVQSQNSPGTVILEIVPAGTVVQPGDFLVRFDSSVLENQGMQQEIVAANSKALLIQAKNLFETAKIIRDEYLQGTFVQEEQLILSEVFVAEENLRKAEDYARYSERLAARGYVTSVQVEADRFAVEKARKDLETAQTKLMVLREFTRKKMLEQYEADVRTAEANLAAAESTHKLDTDKLQQVKDQIAKCLVRAPVAGKVTYANILDRRGQPEVLIEEGAVIRERQPVIRLPDMTKMQVSAKINESKIGFVRVGQRATVRLDAFPDAELSGVVTRVDEYPLPPSFFSGNIKQYPTYVRIDDHFEGMRPGMTAQVEIHVEEEADALTVPVQTVLERNGAYFVLTEGPRGPEPRWIEIGSSNDELVRIAKGLSAGDKVLMNPAQFAERLDFPLPPNYSPEARASRSMLASAVAEAESSADAGAPRRDVEAGGDEGLAALPSPGAMARSIFERHDTNGDGLLSADELPAEFRDRLAEVDSDGDGLISRAELVAAMSRLVRNAPAGMAPAGVGDAQ